MIALQLGQHEPAPCSAPVGCSVHWMRWDFSSWYWGPLCIGSQGQSSAQIKLNIPISAFTEISPKGFTLGVKAENDFNLPLCGLDLAPRLKKDTYQLERPICNPQDQCYNNKILLFWWNSHRRIKLNLRSNPIFSPFIFHLFFILLYSCWTFVFVCEWWKKFLMKMVCQMWVLIHFSLLIRLFKCL